jgi:predicted nucleic acid-binding protein
MHKGVFVYENDIGIAGCVGKRSHGLDQNFNKDRVDPIRLGKRNPKGKNQGIGELFWHDRFGYRFERVAEQMKDYIADTSAWIDYFRGNADCAFMKDLIYSNSLCTNDLILAELLPSILHRGENKLAELMNSLKKSILSIDWQEVQRIQILNLRHGNNHVGLSDIIIAQNCMQNDLKLITSDKHFAAMAKYISLEIRP